MSSTWPGTRDVFIAQSVLHGLNQDGSANSSPGSAHASILLGSSSSGASFADAINGIQLVLDGVTAFNVTFNGTVAGSNLSGTNTGDQTSIVGITGTLSQFNTACTDADFATGGGTATGTNTGDETAAGILAKLVTVDGSGSGLDADLLDGKNTGTSGNTVPLLDGASTWSAAQTFSATPIFSTMTAGSVLFAGTSGTLSQDNSNLFWDDTNNRLSIGAGTAPAQALEVGSTGGTRVRITLAAANSGGIEVYESGNFRGGFLYYQPWNITSFYGPNGQSAMDINSLRQVGLTNNGTTIPADTRFYVDCEVSTNKGIVIRGAASRTAVLVQLQTSAGASLGNVGGTVDHVVTPVSTTSTDGTENNLGSYTSPANSLGVDGDGFRRNCHIATVAHATATRRIRAYFAGTTIWDSGTITLPLATNFWLNIEIIRIDSDSAQCMVSVTTDSAVTVPLVTPTTINGLTFSSTNILKETGVAAGAGAASADISEVSGKTLWLSGAY